MSAPVSFRTIHPTSLLFAIGIAIASSQPAAAQDQPAYVVEGYITAVHIPSGFDVNGEHVATTSQTAYGQTGDKTTYSNSPFRDAVRVGAYVQVEGAFDGHTKTATAVTVFLRDDWDKKLEGMGVIDRVVEAGPEPIFQADGYRIRVNGKAEVSFAGDLKNVEDAGSGNWLRYEAKRGKDGVLEATKAQFLPAKRTKFAAVKGLEISTVKVKPADAKGDDETTGAVSTMSSPEDGATLKEDEKMKIGPFGRWRTIPADQPLQQRVHRVGISLVPHYQRELAEDDPAKIHFRFYAVDEAKMRAEGCLLDGAVLIPTQVVERLKNDDQLAAVLADGVAYNLQRQAARVVSMNRAFLGAAIAGDVAGAFVPGLGVAVLLGSSEAGGKAVIAMEEQRGRVALALMADAGYNPWQAPEAWRLLTPKRLPTDLDSLKYPSRSGYQLGILNLQYSGNRPAAGNKAVGSADAAVAVR